MTLSEFAIELPALIDEAKVRWGDKDNYYKTRCDCDGSGYRINPWHDVHTLTCAKVKSKRGHLYHLEEIIVSDNPVKYLKDHSGKEAS